MVDGFYPELPVGNPTLLFGDVEGGSDDPADRPIMISEPAPTREGAAERLLGGLVSDRIVACNHPSGAIDATEVRPIEVAELPSDIHYGGSQVGCFHM